MEIHPEEVPASLQLFGSDPQILAEMAKRIEERPFSILDLNMGCPVPKVVNNGEGSALMKDPKLVEQILTALVKAINKPVTVKIRKGFDDDHVNAVEIAKIAEAAVWRQWRCTDGPEPSTTADRQTGISSHR